MDPAHCPFQGLILKNWRCIMEDLILAWIIATIYRIWEAIGISCENGLLLFQRSQRQISKFNLSKE